MKPYNLYQRAELYNKTYPHLLPLFVGTNSGRPFLTGYWFVGGGNISDFYGSYQVEYLKRIGSMFPDCKGSHEVMHLFSGSLPPSPDYKRVGKDPTGKYKSDYEIDIHHMSSFIPRSSFSLVYADPPYSEEDSEHYKNSMVNRAKIISETAAVLKPGGWLVWMDQALPLFSNDEIRLVGCISYIRSTGNRFRCVVLFQKPI